MVDLPEPVEPTMRIRPRFSMMQFAQHRRQPQAVQGRDVAGMLADDDGGGTALAEEVHRKLPTPDMPKDRFISMVWAKVASCSAFSSSSAILSIMAGSIICTGMVLPWILMDGRRRRRWLSGLLFRHQLEQLVENHAPAEKDWGASTAPCYWLSRAAAR